MASARIVLGVRCGYAERQAVVIVHVMDAPAAQGWYRVSILWCYCYCNFALVCESGVIAVRCGCAERQAREDGNPRSRFAEQRKIDVETFGGAGQARRGWGGFRYLCHGIWPME